MQNVVIPPFEIIVVKGAAQLTIHSKPMIVIIKPTAGYSDHVAMARFCGVLKPGKVDVCL